MQPIARPPTKSSINCEPLMACSVRSWTVAQCGVPYGNVILKSLRTTLGPVHSHLNCRSLRVRANNMPGGPGMFSLSRSHSAGRGRRVDQFGVNRSQALAPRQLIKVDLVFCGLFVLRPAAQTAEIIIVDLVDCHWASIGVP